MKKDEYIKLYKTITDLKELTPSEKMLLCKIIDLHKAEKGCIALNKYLADFLCVSKGRIPYIIAHLIELGYVERILITKEQFTTERRLIPSQKTLEMITEEEEENPKKAPPKKTPPKVPAEELEEIWKLYRNKKGKADAFKKIPIRLKELGKEQLIRCIERYDNYCKKSDYKFMVYGSTFFNGTYLDYTDENYVSDSQKTKDDREEKIRRIMKLSEEKENAK